MCSAAVEKGVLADCRARVEDAPIHDRAIGNLRTSGPDNSAVID